MQMSPFVSQLAESAEMERFYFHKQQGPGISVKNGIKAGLFQNHVFSMKNSPQALIVYPANCAETALRSYGLNSAVLYTDSGYKAIARLGEYIDNTS